MLYKVTVLGCIHKVSPAVSYFHQIVIAHLFRVIDPLLLLPFGACAQKFSAGTRRGASCNSLLLDQDDVRAAFLCFDCCRQSACACAEYGNINRAHLVLWLWSLRPRRLS